MYGCRMRGFYATLSTIALLVTSGVWLAHLSVAGLTTTINVALAVAAVNWFGAFAWWIPRRAIAPMLVVAATLVAIVALVVALWTASTRRA